MQDNDLMSRSDLVELSNSIRAGATKLSKENLPHEFIVMISRSVTAESDKDDESFIKFNNIIVNELNSSYWIPAEEEHLAKRSKTFKKFCAALILLGSLFIWSVYDPTTSIRRVETPQQTVTASPDLQNAIDFQKALEEYQREVELFGEKAVQDYYLGSEN